ncbi:ABC transporter substrate-binding protein [Bacillus sp. CGMCC 1.16607]|uniref:ABC transporter substrate-binding protein n=1 Tax=Bacillus sp. CGMCC 1.16607 TaxID=3351842 RepID=UPI0036429C6E
MMAFLVGCGESNDKAQDQGSSSKVVKEQESANKTAFPVTVVDGTGKEVIIESEPKTIVSLVPSNTEMTFALGQGDKVIGVSDYCNYPEAVQSIEKVGAQDMNVEKILTLKPDLALVTPFHYQNHPDILQQFKDAGIDVIVVGEALSFKDTYDNLRLIGKVTGSTEAEGIITDMDKRLAEVKEKAKAVKEKKRVWVEVSPAPDIYTTGKNTFMHEMLESINAINVAGDQEGWVKLTEEEIVALNPEVIITTYGYYVKNPAEGVLSREGWKEVPAIQSKQVFDVDNDTVTRPGPRLIDGVETLGKLIYPEIFNQ